MISCAQCIRDLYPGDPRIRTGRYNLSGCDYCDKPEVYRQLENQAPPEQVIVHRHSSMSKLDWDLLQQTARRAEYLEKKLNELQAMSPQKPGKRYIQYKD